MKTQLLGYRLHLPVAERLYTSGEIADRLGVTMNTLRKYRMIKPHIYKPSYRLTPNKQSEARYSEADLKRIIDYMYQLPDK
jgi:predicted transcriptional regulator